MAGFVYKYIYKAKHLYVPPTPTLKQQMDIVNL